MTLLSALVLVVFSSVSMASQCSGSLVPLPVLVRPFIERADGDIQQLRRLIGLEVKGQHRWYPPGKTASERGPVRGVILSVDPAPGKEGIFSMLLQDGDEANPYLFSASNSPSFPTLEVIGVVADEALAADLKSAGGKFVHKFDLLSVGLDTPPETAAYKNDLRKRGAIAFYGTNYPLYEFANFYEAPLFIDGKMWPSTEHYFQAKKFEGTEYEEAIRKAATPAESARMGRVRSHPLRPDWETVKDAVMMKALVAKFTQHPALRDILLSTGDAYLVEHTERDVYWGDGEDGRGNGMLGKLLMELRDEYRGGYLPH